MPPRHVGKFWLENVVDKQGNYRFNSDEYYDSGNLAVYLYICVCVFIYIHVAFVIFGNICNTADCEKHKTRNIV